MREPDGTGERGAILRPSGCQFWQLAEEHQCVLEPPIVVAVGASPEQWLAGAVDDKHRVDSFGTQLLVGVILEYVREIGGRDEGRCGSARRASPRRFTERRKFVSPQLAQSL